MLCSRSRFLPEHAPGHLAVKIGLRSYNVSYQSVNHDNGSESSFYYESKMDMNYGQPDENKILALGQGIPEPIVIIAEYMDARDGGFQWGG